MKKTGCYNLDVMTYAVYLFFLGFAAFLFGLSIFMYVENRKFGDNQFTMKLLPPPARLAAGAVEEHAKTFIAGSNQKVEVTSTPIFSNAA